MITIEVEVEGMPDIEKTFQNFDDVVENRLGALYPHLTRDMRFAINTNADASYQGSPAKEIALQSAQNWVHKPQHHQLDIFSTDYANYRQYGCGGLKIAILVDTTETDLQRMEKTIIDELIQVIE